MVESVRQSDNKNVECRLWSSNTCHTAVVLILFHHKCSMTVAMATRDPNVRRKIWIIYQFSWKSVHREVRECLMSTCPKWMLSARNLKACYILHLLGEHSGKQPRSRVFSLHCPPRGMEKTLGNELTRWISHSPLQEIRTAFPQSSASTVTQDGGPVVCFDSCLFSFVFLLDIVAWGRIYKRCF